MILIQKDYEKKWGEIKQMKCVIKFVYGVFLIGFILGMIGCSQPEPPHVHTFSEAWTTDSTKHWHAATCEHSDEVKGKRLHRFPDTWNIFTVATEEADGLKERFCEVCNYRETQVIPQLKHNHYTATTWTTDSTKHWHAASCGREEHNEDAAEHIWNHEDYQYDSVSSKNIRTCTVCLYVDDIAHVHTEDSGKVTTAVTITTAGIKTYKCTACKAILRTENLPCPKLYSTPVTEKVNGTTYVYFGVWPQSVLPVTSSVTVDETVSVIMGANTYYLGSDGNYYAKCAEKAYGTGAEYKYHDGTQPGRGGTTTRYFKVEPIKWRVLTDNYSGKKLLLAENILTANVPYYNYKWWLNTRTVGSDTNIYPNNYKYSQIRAYLNGLDYYYDTSSTEPTKKTNYTGKGFLQTAFTQDAQALIAETVVDNRKETTGYSESTYAADYACENTTDKIFLLSESEVINSDYGFAAYNSYGKGNTRIRFPTDYAKANYAFASEDDGYGGYWWLRSPFHRDSYNVSYVRNDGDALSYNYVRDTGHGVVPALSISF